MSREVAVSLSANSNILSLSGTCNIHGMLGSAELPCHMWTSARGHAVHSGLQEKQLLGLTCLVCIQLPIHVVTCRVRKKNFCLASCKVTFSLSLFLICFRTLRGKKPQTQNPPKSFCLLIAFFRVD